MRVFCSREGFHNFKRSQHRKDCSRMMFIIYFLLTFLLYSESISTQQVADEKYFSSAREGDTKYVEAYLEANPSHVSARDTRGNNALVIAAGRGRIDVLRVLLKYHANPEDYTNTGLFDGKSALSWAASQGTPYSEGVSHYPPHHHDHHHHHHHYLL